MTTHAMTLVDPYVVHEKNIHAMTLAVVNEKNKLLGPQHRKQKISYDENYTPRSIY